VVIPASHLIISSAAAGAAEEAGKEVAEIRSLPAARTVAGKLESRVPSGRRLKILSCPPAAASWS
jgi:hypothetical protein